MLVSYDFDIRWIIPRDLKADPAIEKLVGDIGLNTDASGHYVAVFRDPAVVAMIERADPVLREYLKASGFGFVASESSVPTGFYPPEDESALSNVIQRLNETLPKFPMEGADLGGFDLAVFLAAMETTRPLPEDAGAGRKSRVKPIAQSMPPQNLGVAHTDPVAPALRSRFGAFVLNLLGLSLVFYIAVKLFAAPAEF